MEEFYTYIIAIAVVYYLMATLTEFDFLISPLTLGLPYGLFAWGLSGYLGTEEPAAFGLGFGFTYGVITILYIFMTSSGSIQKMYLLKDGEVTINIFPNKFGEIKVKNGESFDFLQAKAVGITKPIVKGSFVKIEKFTGPTAFVTSEYESIEIDDNRGTLTKGITSFIRLLLPRPKISGVCMICYGTLTRSKEGTKCPNCDAVAHFEHIEDWLKMKKKCPNCKTTLNMSGRILELA